MDIRLSKNHRLTLARDPLMGSTISGGADRDRTDDLRRARAAFSQLNYCPKSYSSRNKIRFAKNNCRKPAT